MPNARALYRCWYAAAGPWAGFFRAVPLVALARGIGTLPGAPPPEGVAGELARVGAAEGWLGRPAVLLLLDLPGAQGIATAVGLAPYGVRPVLVLLRWPEPGAVLGAEEVLAALCRYAPATPRGRGRATAVSPDQAGAAVQYAFVLERERARAVPAPVLARRFDNRYTLGPPDLPDAARLRAAGIQAVVACWLAACPPAADTADYLEGLEAAGLAVRRLALPGATRPGSP
ncbi:MAG TPA: hypothetical protein VFB73_17275 [Chloroflexota bacterium]|nr:hypothetical protein [Chloroflexota bacterium]